MNVRISVITPSYNYGRYIDDCLDSVHHQSLAAHEHLVLDDGSSDDSAERARHHPGNAQVWEQENAGLAVTLNRLLERSSGDWIGWLNADDFYLEDTLARVANIVEREPSIDVIVGDTVFVDQEARVLRLLPGHPITKSVTLHYGMTAAPSSFFVRASTIRPIGFREGTKFLMDKWLFSELATRHAVSRYVSTPLGAMRRHDQQVSANARDAGGDDERRAFRMAFGLPESGAGLSRSRLYGRCLHAALKVATGGYVRELRWQSKQDQDSRWW